MNIRKKLSRIVLSSGTNGFRRWYTPGLFEKYVAALLPKEIKIIAPPPIKEENFNCFIYALGLHRDQGVISTSKGFIFSSFMETLLTEQEVEVTAAPTAGDIVLYRNPAKCGKNINDSIADNSSNFAPNAPVRRSDFG